MREVRGALLQRPTLHRLRDGVGQRGVERFAGGERRLQRAEYVLGQPRLLDVRAEDVAPKTSLPGTVRSGDPSAPPPFIHCAAVTFCCLILLMVLLGVNAVTLATIGGRDLVPADRPKPPRLSTAKAVGDAPARCLSESRRLRRGSLCRRRR